MDKKELEKRTKKFALEVIKFVADLPNNKITNMLGYQLLKCGTSIGANYREANRAQSRKDFIHKIAVVEKEASETQYWLELFDALQMGDLKTRSWLLSESDELLAIFTSIGKTIKRRQKVKKA
jgi:four helix bundle protein